MITHRSRDDIIVIRNRRTWVASSSSTTTAAATTINIVFTSMMIILMACQCCHALSRGILLRPYSSSSSSSSSLLLFGGTCSGMFRVYGATTAGYSISTSQRSFLRSTSDDDDENDKVFSKNHANDNSIIESEISSFDDGTDNSPVTRARLLPNILRYRGVVDRGYGRGGKKLGVPTANLPSSLFQNALEDVTTGVYFGWAVLEGGRGDGTYKAVVNVGYSPTFEGQENREKIIEAHLIVDDGITIPDFYDVPMRLQLIGFLREEKKFDSFPELIAQIQADITDAKLSLDCQPYVSCRSDPFLLTNNDTEQGPNSITSSTWVGNDGGDKVASWEVRPMMDLLERVL